MTIYLGADHRGFALKEKIKEMLTNDGYSAVDLGAPTLVPGDDYPVYARAVAEAVGKTSGEGDDGDRGVVICGSGIGADITANKITGVRSALPMSPDHIYVGRNDDNVNVIALAADFIDEPTAEKIVKTFLSTPFAREERYVRRLDEIAKMELGR